MTSPRRAVRIVYPHQLFGEHLDAAPGTRFVLVEDDLFYRQYRFHAHKLVLHRASLAAFADLLRDNGFDVDVIESLGHVPTGPRLADLIGRLRPDRVSVVDVVDDWLARDCVAALADGGYRLRAEDVEESPNFLTTRADVDAWFATSPARMQSFYAWQRRRLGVLVEGDRPVGGKWSFDPENRRRLPAGHPVPEPVRPRRDAHVRAAIDWVAGEFPDAPGDPGAFAWPTTPAAARAALRDFLTSRLAQFGPYEDAIATAHPVLFHSALTPPLNVGLLSPADLLDGALDAAAHRDVPIASLEGFVRQVIGWREYMRATYRAFGRRMRTSNTLRHDRPLAPGWWDASTGLDPVDHVVRGVLHRGWAHHIERLMVLGNAMCLLRTHPDAVHEWFMELFVDAYDWVMVPNVYAMSQFAAGGVITTKPYVSGSAYLRRMSDLPAGEWTHDWDALYWSFVADHHDLLAGNPRTRVITRGWEGMDDGRRRALVARAGEVRGRL